MSDNVRLNPGASGDLMATDEVSYSGDTAQVQLVRVVSVTGAEGSKAVGADLASTVKATDTPFTNGDPGVLMLAKRRDADTTTVSADGDYTTLNMDEVGRLKVAVQPAGYPLTTGNITSNTSTVPVNVARVSNVMVYVAGTFAGVNFTFEGSLNSTNGTDGNWFGIQAVRSNANTIETTSGVLAAAPAYGWELSVNGLNWFRVRATAWTSGTAGIQIQPGAYATEPIPAAQISGTQPVSGTVTASNTAGTAAEDAAASGNPVMVGGVARTANAATTLVAGDAVRHTMTSGAALVVKQYGPMQVEFSPTLNLTTTTPAAIAAAAAAGIRNHLTAFWAMNTSASAVDLIILDGATERHRYPLPPNVPVFMRFPTGLVTTAATALNANLSAAATSVRVNFTGYTSA